jgi:hypothetical protein
MLRVGQATDRLHRVGGLLLLRGTGRVRVGVCWELNPEPNIVNCARGSAIGIGMCVERAEGLLDFEIVGVLDPARGG